jgi:hypothetical protein
MNLKAYGGLLVLSIVATVGGVLTLMPASGASYPNILGYRSLCTFAPAATLYCFSVAGITCVLRASLIKRKAFSGGTPQFRFPPIAAVSVVLVAAVAATFWFTAVKSQYPDSTTTATTATAE